MVGSWLGSVGFDSDLKAKFNNIKQYHHHGPNRRLRDPTWCTSVPAASSRYVSHGVYEVQSSYGPTEHIFYKTWTVFPHWSPKYIDKKVPNGTVARQSGSLMTNRAAENLDVIDESVGELELGRTSDTTEEMGQGKRKRKANTLYDEFWRHWCWMLKRELLVHSEQIT